MSGNIVELDHHELADIRRGSSTVKEYMAMHFPWKEAKKPEWYWRGASFERLKSGDTYASPLAHHPIESVRGGVMTPI